ncbi:hypothetical protein PCASD_16464 [Puccinia coronata f. sp. avenae]|uniref:DUF6589 domain-containing protein n=1 Tax=Puccinia coronata f. sp. avenae TaxID=200324 RepID=A0A2N5TXH6_9BASI|nr:hypothetical protein PCASD_16464 [Puccinia coronata f. sp. avenae]
MVLFACNQRQNGFQLSNSLVFIASGVSERVNAYLNYIGLCSSRKTAHAGLNLLGKEAEENVKDCFKLPGMAGIAPLICFDNIDFQKSAHMKSVGHGNVMFHGTWGYIHSIPPRLLPSIDPTEITTEALNCSLHNGSKMTISPDVFAPTRESIQHFELTIKSQLTGVVLDYFAEQTNTAIKLSRDPPPVLPNKPDSPNITMLKLMLASDNLAQGVGKVFTGLIEQSGLTAEEFRSRLQIIEGDLGSCNIFDSLRRQREPARHMHTSLDNILLIPGAAHTLWNMAQATYLGHSNLTQVPRLPEAGARSALCAAQPPVREGLGCKSLYLA